MSRHKILVGSPVCQRPDILQAFLYSLKNLNSGTMVMDFIFADDNKDEKSSQLLATFTKEHSHVVIFAGNGASEYQCDEKSHYWNDDLMFRVAILKNKMIKYAIDNNYDEIFFVDSDIVLHQDIVLHLQRQQRDVISEIFWTQWHPLSPKEPNVWLFDEYDLVPKKLGEVLSKKEMENRQAEFLDMLRKPGVYDVGGLGACTLISRQALLKGVNFSPIKNLTIHGEDRFFCIRAAVLGIELFIDTAFPAYHIYRQTDLAGVSKYESKCKSETIKGKITLSMIVKNEENRYLSRVLESLKGHIDQALIIDDASTDNTVEICEKLLCDIPHRIIKNKKSQFANEVSLRQQQWEETVKLKPDWILNLDADEIIEDSFWGNAHNVIDNYSFQRCSLRLYDMWSEKAYREDKYWNAHKASRTFLVRYGIGVEYKWNEKPQHCGRFPLNCDTFANADTDYRIQHFGWATKEDRQAKYERYKLLDPDAVYGIKAQYDSILDEKPTIKEWR